LFAASPDGMTADECAASLGEDLLSIRPRVTELKLRGLLSDSGQRRPTRYGRSQRVMVHYIHD
jgi:hypothetical protein